MARHPAPMTMKPLFTISFNRCEKFVFPPHTLFVYDEQPCIQIIGHELAAVNKIAVAVSYGGDFLHITNLPHGLLFTFDESPC